MYFLFRLLYNQPYNAVGPIEIIQNDPLRIGYLIGISLGVGAGLSFLIFAYLKIVKRLSKRSERIERLRQRLTRGYTTDKSPVWPDIIQEYLDQAKSSIGKEYSVSIQIFLKDAYNNTRSIKGLVYQIDDVKPADIFVSSRYVASCRDRAHLSEMLEMDLTEIIDELKRNKNYYEGIKRYIGGYLSEEHLASEIIKRLRDNTNAEEFFRILQKIDLSKYVAKLTDRFITTDNSTPRLEYQKPKYTYLKTTYGE